MAKREITSQEALKKLRKSNHDFIELFTHGSLLVELYKPDKIDYQKPHDRDEIYVIVSGTGTFFNGRDKMDFSPGDFLFVPAGTEHRFEKFSDDFATWVFFYGPMGGEAEGNQQF